MYVCMSSVMEIKVVDVSGSTPVEDAVFPRLDPSKHSSWSGGGDSIRLTGETIRQLGVEGQYFAANLLPFFFSSFASTPKSVGN
jgi:hypothetical protein